MFQVEGVRLRIKRCVEINGSYRNAARALGLDNHTFLFRVAKGEKEPSDAILDALGIERVVAYKNKRVPQLY